MTEPHGQETAIVAFHDGADGWFAIPVAELSRYRLTDHAAARLQSLLESKEDVRGFGPRARYKAWQLDAGLLVAFAAGDTRHPYGIGALWGGKDRPPGSR